MASLLKSFIRQAVACLGLGLIAIFFGCRTSNDHLIVPGERVGEIVIGRTLGSRIGKADGTINSRFSLEGVDIGLDRDSRVSDVLISKPTYRTPEGITVGAKKDEVIAAYGRAQLGDFTVTDRGFRRPQLPNALVYPGIEFVLKSDDAVAAIFVKAK